MRQSSTPEPPVHARAHRLHITCVRCRRRHSLERLLTEPETVYIICHDCESSLAAHYYGVRFPELSRPPGREPETTL
ncbi:MAG: hypothetical protein JWM18_2959 [Chloroflexi bacterium]|nr:hypothetical protein [Chloroflexota bacterium]